MFVISETDDEIFLLTSNFKHLLLRRPALRFQGHKTFQYFKYGYIEGAWLVYFLYHNFLNIRNIQEFLQHLEYNYSGYNINKFKKSWIWFIEDNFSLSFNALWLDVLLNGHYHQTKQSMKYIKQHMDRSMTEIPGEDLRKAKSYKQNVSHYIGVKINKKTRKSHRVFYQLHDIPGKQKWVVEVSS